VSIHEEPSTPKYKAYITVEVDFTYNQFKKLRSPESLAQDFVECIDVSLHPMLADFPEIQSMNIMLDEVV
jgi:hypothetical protein